MIRILKKFIFTRYLTFKKLKNFLKASYSYLFSGNVCVSHLPVKLVIDIGNFCNLKCPLCPTGQNKNSRTKAFMSFNEFKKIIDEVKDYIYEIDLYNWGEPFLNQEVYKMIEYAQNSNISTHINSNLNILNDEEAEIIVKSGLHRLTVSLDGVSRETYSKYRVGGSFDTVINNIQAVIDAKKKLKSKFPIITWQFLIMKHNENEIEKARKLCKKIGVDHINFRKTRCDMGQEIFLDDSKKIESTSCWLPSNEENSRYSYKKKSIKKRLKKCLFLKTTMTVNSNGSVSPCCAVYDEKWDFGNALFDGLINIWNNDKYQRARTLTMRMDDSDKSLICSYCVNNGFIEY